MFTTIRYAGGAVIVEIEGRIDARVTFHGTSTTPRAG